MYKEYICKKNLLTFFKKGDVYKVTNNISCDYDLVQIGYVNFSYNKEKSTKISEDLADFIIVWLDGEIERMIKNKGLTNSLTYITPYIYEYFESNKILIGKKLKKLNL